MANRSSTSVNRITMEDIASEAGVSAMTVSRVLRSSSAVLPETRDRILDIIERLGFVPDQSAGALSSRRSGFVAMIVPSLNNSNFADTHRGLTNVLRQFGLNLLAAFSDYSLQQEENIIETMLRRRPEGIVLAGARSHMTKRSQHLLKMSRIPVIQTWDVPDEPIDHVVGFSNFNAAYVMVEHLWSREYRRIAFLGSSALGNRGSKRISGYLAAMKKFGGAPTIVDTGPVPATMEQGQRALDILTKQRPDADAVLCISDPLAFGLLMACNRQGVAVPSQIAIAGFGDFDIGRWSHPTLTTVQVGSYEMGALAGRLMLDAIDAGREGQIIKPTVRETGISVIAREST
jgi:LacI family gluconate utilization system Gnt-I transcriptional repressor